MMKLENSLIVKKRLMITSHQYLMIWVSNIYQLVSKVRKRWLIAHQLIFPSFVPFMILRGLVAHQGPQSRRRCIYWFRSSSQTCPVCERRSVHFSRLKSLLGKGVLATPLFAGPFCRSMYCPAFAYHLNKLLPWDCLNSTLSISLTFRMGRM